MSDYIIGKINEVMSVLDHKVNSYEDIKNNVFIFVALSDIFVDMSNVDKDIETYSKEIYGNDLFDILMISEIAYKGENYDVHNLYNEQEIQRYLTDIAIGKFIQLFVRERRALLTTLTDGVNSINVPFGDIFRSYNITLSDLFMEYMALKRLNERASELTVKRQKVRMREMIQLRDDLTRILEDIMAVSLQRIIARDTAFRKLVSFMGVSKLRTMVESKLDKLENIIRSEYELKSNILLIILNAFTLVSILITLYEFIKDIFTPIQYVSLSIAMGIIWLFISIKYLQQYIM